MTQVYNPDDIKLYIGGEEVSPAKFEDIEVYLKCTPERTEEYKRIVLGVWDTENLENGFPKSNYTYTRITSAEDMPDNNIVYQNDCGWWYDWDLSGKSEDELETLFQTNIIYKREEKQ